MPFQYFDTSGHEIVADDAIAADGSLKAGVRSVRVPMMLMDGEPKYRTVRESLHDAYMRGLEDGKRRRKTLHRDPMGREMGTSEEVEEEEPRRRRQHDAALGFTDARGVRFGPDPR